MTPTDHDVDPVDGEGRTGLNRRQMIKAAGIAGAAAWTAPIIIDSLASPAAAATVRAGLLRHVQPIGQRNVASLGFYEACRYRSHVCANSGVVPATTLAAALAAVNLPTPNVADNSTAQVTVSIKPGFSCRIVSASATVTTGIGDANTYRELPRLQRYK